MDALRDREEVMFKKIKCLFGKHEWVKSLRPDIVQGGWCIHCGKWNKENVVCKDL